MTPTASTKNNFELHLLPSAAQCQRKSQIRSSGIFMSQVECDFPAGLLQNSSVGIMQWWINLKFCVVSGD